VSNINNTWKTGLNKGGNIDIAFYGNQDKQNERETVKQPEVSQKKADYVDVIIEKTEKLQFANDSVNSYNTSNVNVGQKGNNANLIDFGSVSANVNPNINTIIKPEQKEKAITSSTFTSTSASTLGSTGPSTSKLSSNPSNISSSNSEEKASNPNSLNGASSTNNLALNDSTSGMTKTVTIPSNINNKEQLNKSIKIEEAVNKPTSSTSSSANKPSESFTINDNINFNNQNLNFGQSSNANTNVPKQTIPTANTSSTKQDEILIDDVLDNSLSSSKINLGSIKDKKNFTGDRNFMINEKKDYSGIQSKIDTGIRTKASVSIPLSDPSVNDELAKKYEQIEKEKQEKLKDYRDLILKMKKDKRSVEKQKEETAGTGANQFEIKEDQLSDEVKKRLEMRKQLADRLKK
jgi:hypothetical protein